MDASRNATLAVVLMALLIGGEVAALRTTAKTAGEESQQLEVGGPLHWFTGGNDVCRRHGADENEDAGVKRYHQKVRKFMNKVNNLQNCGMTCHFQWNEVAKRIKRFASCAWAVDPDVYDPITVSDGLRDAITTGDLAIQRFLMMPQHELRDVIQRIEMFPMMSDFPGCEFVPTDINPEDLSPFVKAMDVEGARNEIRELLFKEGCDEQSSKKYVKRLSGNARKIAEYTLDQVERLLQLVEVREDEARARSIIDDIVNSAGDSLLEVKVGDASAKSNVEDMMSSEGKQAQTQAESELAAGTGMPSQSLLLDVMWEIMGVILYGAVSTIIDGVSWAEQGFRAGMLAELWAKPNLFAIQAAT